MKKAGIISIGNELLTGQTVDTNSAFLCNKLLGLGISVEGVYTVGDDIEKIVKAIQTATDEADIVISTGGLGPTDDDLTRYALAKLLDCELVFKKDLMEKIEDYFKSHNYALKGSKPARQRKVIACPKASYRGQNGKSEPQSLYRMSEKNRIQAYIPACSEAIENGCGTAAGILAEKNGKLFIAVPGVPSEMKEMIERVAERIKAFAGAGAIAVKKLNCFGAGESNVAERLGALMRRDRNPLINCTVNESCITLHIIATAENEKSALESAVKDQRHLEEILGELVYSSGDVSLAEAVGQKLLEQKKSLAVAESCTGGLLAKLLTDIPGASGYFLRGWVTYSNEAKIEELCVPRQLLDKYGAVSEQVAKAMARGAREKTKADYAIAITGIAGPTGGSDTKPVGLVYICLTSDKETVLKKFVLTRKRADVRLKGAMIALNLLRLKMVI